MLRLLKATRVPWLLVIPEAASLLQGFLLTLARLFQPLPVSRVAFPLPLVLKAVSPLWFAPILVTLAAVPRPLSPMVSTTLVMSVPRVIATLEAAFLAVVPRLLLLIPHLLVSPSLPVLALVLVALVTTPLLLVPRSIPSALGSPILASIVVLIVAFTFGPFVQLPELVG